MDPVPHLHLVKDKEDFSALDEGDEPLGLATLYFDYGGVKVHPLQQTAAAKIQRNTSYEKSVLQRLDDLGLIADEFDEDDDDGLRLEPAHIRDTWFHFMVHHRSVLEGEGWSIGVDEDFPYQFERAETWYADISEESVQGFRLELGIIRASRKINLLPFLVDYLSNAIEQKKVAQLQDMRDDYPLLFKQGDDRILNVPFIRVRSILQVLIQLNDPRILDQNGRLWLARQHSAQLALLKTSLPSIQWSGGSEFRKLGDRLVNFSAIGEVNPPVSLNTELRDYQKAGLNWLQFLREYELGGILADDMGLGKTVQTLAHILLEKQNRRARIPCLVIAPTSLMMNWSREAEKFTPELSVLMYQGAQRKHLRDQMQDVDIVLSTYPVLTRDSDFLLARDWYMVVLDEAQHIKNTRSKAAQTAKKLKSAFRLCLTGTPMENHLGELWSQFDFVMPGFMGSEKQFKQWYRLPIEKQQDAARQLLLRERIAPFLLRREKSSVARELLPKTEIVSVVELDGAQCRLYEKIRASMVQKVNHSIADKGLKGSQITILDALLKLRQICCHPQLLKLPEAKKIQHSAKMAQLMEMLPEMVDEGRRILLFSQFTSMLTLIECELKAHNISYVKLTGQTRNRQLPVDEFQSGHVPLFLISLKAGGVGLNLTRADTVIHYDPWWNPATERQATDRAHRIGQEKPVFVYKLITANTVEQKIAEMQVNKQQLADGLLNSDNKTATFSQADLLALFEPSG